MSGLFKQNSNRGGSGGGNRRDSNREGGRGGRGGGSGGRGGRPEPPRYGPSPAEVTEPNPNVTSREDEIVYAQTLTPLTRQTSTAPTSQTAGSAPSQNAGSAGARTIVPALPRSLERQNSKSIPSKKPGPATPQNPKPAPPQATKAVPHQDSKAVPVKNVEPASLTLPDISKLKLQATGLPIRPGYGQGDKSTLYTNYFEVRRVPGTTTSQTLYRYSMTIESTKVGKPAPTGRRQQQIVRIMLETVPRYRNLSMHLATDWKSNLITARPLFNETESQEETVIISYRANPQEVPQDGADHYSVRVKPYDSGHLNTAELGQWFAQTDRNVDWPGKKDFIQAFNIIVADFAKRESNIRSTVGQKVYAIPDLYGPQAGAGASQAGVGVSPLYVDDEKAKLGDNLIALRGYFASIRPATKRLLLNVNITHGAFVQHGPLLNLMPQDRNIARTKSLVRMLRVRVTHMRDTTGQPLTRFKTIVGVAEPSDGQGQERPPRVPYPGAKAAEVEFWLTPNNGSTSSSSEGRGAQKGKPSNPSGAASGGRYISVKEYFKQQHGVIVRTDMPVLNAGTSKAPVYLPPDVCIVMPGQPSTRSLTGYQTANMIKYAVRRPAENAESIVNQSLLTLGLEPSLNQRLANFSLKFTPELLTVSGRVLQAPQVLYGGNPATAPMQFKPANGSWDLKAVQFKRRAQIDTWSVVQVVWQNGSVLESGHLETCVGALSTKLKNLGVRIASSPRVTTLTIAQPRDAQIETYLRKSKKEKDDFVLFILPKREVALYNYIKLAGDVICGVQTVCVVANKFSPSWGKPPKAVTPSDQYLGNVAMKINLKLGGINHTVAAPQDDFIQKNQTMIVGIDVTHPSPGSARNAPSVAAMVASIDPELGQWPAALTVQTGRQEMVDCLDRMLTSRLNLWKTKGKHTEFPRNILVYRDGVSEGQYEQVLTIELPQLRKACDKLYKAARQALPKITIVIVGKRHHTRFYPSKASLCDSSGNTPNGTVVDRGITEARTWDFFLQAHTALQGTARPAHYVVLLDEIFRSTASSGLQAAALLENITHRMCYTFVRATKSVSICPPAYYADIICERARCYLARYMDQHNAGNNAGTATQGAPLGMYQIHADLEDSMFYM